MKKSFLSALGLFAAGAAMAFSPEPQRLPAKPTPGFNVVEIESFTESPAPLSRADEQTLDYAPAFDPYQAISFNNLSKGSTIAQALEFAPADVTLFSGSKVTAVSFYTGTNATSNKNQIKTYTVFLSNNLNKDPFYTQEFEVTSAEPFKQYTVELDQPYTLEAGKPLFAGVMCKITASNDIPIIIDGMAHYDDFGGWVGVNTGAGALQWQNLTSNYGFVCIGATIKGTGFPENLVAIEDWAVNSSIVAETDNAMQILAINNGVTPVKSMEITYGFDGEQQRSESFDFPNNEYIGFKKYGVITISNISYPKPAGTGVKLNFAVTKVNGVANEDAKKAASEDVIVVPSTGGYARRALVEEFTGTWCGWCPTGISTMERIREEYTAKDGSIIPIAVHVNGAVSDPMTSTAFSKVAALNTGGVPNAIINRMAFASPQGYDDFIEACKSVMSLPAVGKVELTAKADDDGVELTATTEFLFDFTDADERYIVAFAITENNVGPYKQTNYYAGEDGDYYGWENKSSSVTMNYNDVARQLATFNGLSGSVPPVVKAGQPNEFTYTINFSNKIIDKNNLNYIAYLLDRKTGAVENAAIITADGYVGIEEVEAATDENAPVEYFNLQGIRVENPSNGLYIRRQGSTTTKVLVK